MMWTVGVTRCHVLLACALAGCTDSASTVTRLTACEAQAEVWCGPPSVAYASACARVWVDQWCDPPHWTDPVETDALNACLDAIESIAGVHRDVPAECWRTWVRQDGFRTD